RATAQRVVHSAPAGRAATDRVIDSDALAGERGERHGQIGGRDRLRAAGTGQIESDGGRSVVIEDRAGAAAAGDGRAGGVAEVDSESFVYFVNVVAVDRDGEGLRCDRISGKSQCAALGDVVGGSGRGAVGGVVVNGDALRTGSREAHAEGGVGRRAAVPFAQGDIVDGNGGAIVVDDGCGDLLGARLGAVGDARDIHNDGFVHLVDGILDRGESDRAGGVAGRDHDRGARGSVIAGQGGGARECQIDSHRLRINAREGGCHGGHASGFGHGAAGEAQGHRRWRVVIEDRPGAGGGGERRIRW